MTVYEVTWRIISINKRKNEELKTKCALMGVKLKEPKEEIELSKEQEDKISARIKERNASLIKDKINGVRSSNKNIR